MATRCGAIVLALVVLIGLPHARSFADGEYNDKATSANGQWKVEIKVVYPKGGTALGFTVTQKKETGDFQEVATGVIDDLSFSDRFKDGILCRTSISDGGKFAVVGIVGDENKTVISLHSNDGRRVAALQLSQILTEQEISGLTVFSKHFPYLRWHKQDSLKIEGDDLLFETPAGRKVKINLADGKVAKDSKGDDKEGEK